MVGYKKNNTEFETVVENNYTAPTIPLTSYNVFPETIISSENWLNTVYRKKESAVQ